MLSGCGLEEYYMLEAPYRAYNLPTYSTLYDRRYFEFLTNESANKSYLDSDSAFKFLGTAIYYKIYNNYSTMTAHDSVLSSKNSSSDYSAAASTMIETYGFRQLGTDDGTMTPLIEATGINRKVYIRLMNYQDLDNFAARIEIDGVPMTKSGGGNVVPLRTGNRYTFDFGRRGLSTDSDNNKLPADGDEDVYYSSSFSDSDKKIWYVDVYAVAVGRDATYTTYYSNVLHLGSVPIDSGERDN